MALLAAIGFELDTLTAGAETPLLTEQNGITGLSLVTSPVQTGTYALKGVSGATNGQLLIDPLSTDHKQYQKVSLNIGTLPNAATTVMIYVDANFGIALAYIDITSTGALQLWYSNSTGGFTQIGSNSSTLSTNTWYDVELHIDDTGGTSSYTIEARLNESVFATGTGLSVEATGNGGVPGGYASIGNCIQDKDTASIIYFDNWVLTDNQGTSMAGYPGNVRVARVTPNAAGDTNTFATQTGGTAGAANNFTRVDETTPDNATTFNGSSTLNQEDLYNVTDPGIGGSDTVLAVQVMGVYRNNTADATAAAKLEIEKASAGTILQGSAIIPNSTSWQTTSPSLSIIAYNDPDGAAWTETTLATMQIGYKLTTANTNRIDFSTVWANVLYTPGTPPTSTGGLLLMGVGT